MKCLAGAMISMLTLGNRVEEPLSDVLKTLVRFRSVPEPSPMRRTLSTRLLLWQGPPSRLPIDVGVVSEDDYARLTAKMVPSPVPADRSAFLMHPG